MSEPDRKPQHSRITPYRVGVVVLLLIAVSLARPVYVFVRLRQIVGELRNRSYSVHTESAYIDGLPYWMGIDFKDAFVTRISIGVYIENTFRLGDDESLKLMAESCSLIYGDLGTPGECGIHLCEGSTITNDGLTCLNGLRQLAELELHSPAITDEGLIQLKGLTNLRKLQIGGRGISGSGLKHLKGLRNLTDLNLWDSAVTDANLVHLKDLPQLRTLGLGWTRLTDAGVTSLAECKKLEFIDTRHTKLTDHGQQLLWEQLPQLKVQNRE